MHITDIIRGNPDGALVESIDDINPGEPTSERGGMQIRMKLQAFATSVVKVIMTLTAADINSS